MVRVCFLTFLALGAVSALQVTPIPATEEEPLDAEDIAELCDLFKTVPRDPPVRVWDGIIINDELDMLEVRLHELYPVVDKFVITEATRTHTNLPKKLHFGENKDRFAPYMDKIIHIVVDDLPDAPAAEGNTTEHWLRERFIRDAILRGTGDASPQDIIFISDADEIPWRETVQTVKLCVHGVTHNRTLEVPSLMYYYNLNWQWFEGDNTPHYFPFAIKAARHAWFAEKNRTPTDLRLVPLMGEERMLLKGQGWHFSYFGGVEQIQRKILAWPHQEYNKPEFRTTEHIRNVIDNGLDLFQRPPGYLRGRSLLCSGIQIRDGRLISDFGPLPSIFKQDTPLLKIWFPRNEKCNQGVSV